MLDHRNIQPFFRPTHARYLRSRDVPVGHDLGQRSDQKIPCLRSGQPCTSQRPLQKRLMLHDEEPRKRGFRGFPAKIYANRPTSNGGQIQKCSHCDQSRLVSMKSDRADDSCAHRRPRFLDRIDIRPQIVAGDTGRRFCPQDESWRHLADIMYPFPY